MKKTTIDENFPLRLKELIEVKLRLTQGEFAKNIGVTAGYVSMVVTGKRGPSAEMIAGLYINYSKYLKWLLTGISTEKKEGADTSRKYEILDEVEEWLTEEVKKNPGRETWFEFQMIDSFESFKKWKEGKGEERTGKGCAPNRKVA